MKNSAGLQKWVSVDGASYDLEVVQRVSLPVSAPRLLIVSYLPAEDSFDILRVCVQAIQKFTPEAHEIWIVDNCSPRSQSDRLFEFSNVNLVFNHTKPYPRNLRWKRYFGGKYKQQDWGSYSNAVALELGRSVIDPETQLLMTMHMDVMPCRVGWLSFLMSKLNDQVKAAGVRLDKARVPAGILHVLGYLVDFQLFSQMKLDFFPDLPAFDVGDLAIFKLRDSGYDIHACPNSLWDETLVDSLPPDSPFRLLRVDRSFDDSGNVIYLHLGRGVRKSSGEAVNGVSTEEWIKFADGYLLK